MSPGSTILKAQSECAASATRAVRTVYKSEARPDGYAGRNADRVRVLAKLEAHVHGLPTVRLVGTHTRPIVTCRNMHTTRATMTKSTIKDVYI